MRRMFAVTRRILAQFLHDKRTLGLLFIAPLVVLWLLSVLLGADVLGPRIATVDLPPSVQTALESQKARVQNVTPERAEELIRTAQVDAVVSLDGKKLNLRVEGADSGKTLASQGVVAKALSEVQRDAGDQIKADVEAKKAEVAKKQDEIKAKRDEVSTKVKAVLEDAASDSQAKLKSSLTTALKDYGSKQPAQLQAAVSKAMQEFAASRPDTSASLDQALASVPEPARSQLKAGITKAAASAAQQQQADLKAALTKAMGSYAKGQPAQLQSAINKALAGMGDQSSVKVSLEEAFAGMDDLGTIEVDLDTAKYLVVEDVVVSYQHGSEDWKSFDFFGPVFVGIFVFVFTFITSGMSLVNERAAGTMTRFLATPVRPLEVMGGYALGFGALAVVQTGVILAVALNLIGFPNEGDLGLVIFICMSLAIASVTLGLLVSGLAKTAFQVIQLILMFVSPQILLSGLFDLAAAPGWLQFISNCLPLTYGVSALRDVMLRGATVDQVALNLGVVWAFIAAFFVLASLGFRKKRARLR